MKIADLDIDVAGGANVEEEELQAVWSTEEGRLWRVLESLQE